MNCELCILSDGIMEGGERKEMFFHSIEKTLREWGNYTVPCKKQDFFLSSAR